MDYKIIHDNRSGAYVVLNERYEVFGYYDTYEEAEQEAKGENENG